MIALLLAVLTTWTWDAPLTDCPGTGPAGVVRYELRWREWCCYDLETDQPWCVVNTGTVPTTTTTATVELNDPPPRGCGWWVRVDAFDAAGNSSATCTEGQ
jgi:hypothetical protein